MSDYKELYAWTLIHWGFDAIHNGQYVGRDELKNRLINRRWPDNNFNLTSKRIDVQSLNRAVNAIDA